MEKIYHANTNHKETSIEERVEHFQTQYIHTNYQQAYEKILNIYNLQWIVNQNYKISLYNC